jgi:hypothetical protein
MWVPLLESLASALSLHADAETFPGDKCHWSGLEVLALFSKLKQTQIVE